MFGCTVPSSAPIKVRARAVSSNTVVAQWDEPLVPNGIVRVSTAQLRMTHFYVRSAASFIWQTFNAPWTPDGRIITRLHCYWFFCHGRNDGIVLMKRNEQQLVAVWNGLPSASSVRQYSVTKTLSNASLSLLAATIMWRHLAFLWFLARHWCIMMIHFAITITDISKLRNTWSKTIK